MKKLVTSALPYVNNQPHLGNVVGCVLSADVYSRYCKKIGENCVHVCGTDEYGTAIEMEAVKMGKTPQQICEENRVIHKRVYDWFDIHFDHFGYTSCEAHTLLVQRLFLLMYNNGYFRKEDVEQLYCGCCNVFLADRYVIGTCKFCEFEQARGDQCDGCGRTYKPVDLVSPKCTVCSSVPTMKRSEHLFFDLATFKPQLEQLYEENGKFWSENTRNIFEQWIRMDLHSRCMTRDLRFKWGVPVPLEGFEEKVFYVWFDAPIGYLTFLQELVGGEFEKWCDEAELVQFMGKDNVSFHTVVFPAMLMATEKRFPLVKRLSATEYLMFEGKKFSKSRGHGIFGMDLVGGELGNSCVWRYYLMKIRPETKDSNFSFSDFRQSVTGDLINNIGNFVNRVLKYIEARCKGNVSVGEMNGRDEELVTVVRRMYGEYLGYMGEIGLRDALVKTLEISGIGNEYIQKEGVGDATRRDHCFCVGFSIIVLLGHLLSPFIPVTSSKIFKMCNMEEGKFPESFEIVRSHVIEKGVMPLFEHFSKEQVERMKMHGEEKCDEIE